ncbi:hypothetical protein, partial [Pseudomonas sp. 2995-3]|uniref:hypothetical protein n=1 Tax=Pseudomonas sp. 2995-3 TaxID=1712680 RepID=UPI001C487D74
PGAGKYPTASAIVEDVINLLTNSYEKKVSSNLAFMTDGFLKEEQIGFSKTSSYDYSLYFVTAREDISQYSSSDFHVLEMARVHELSFGALVHTNKPLTEIRSILGENNQILPILSEVLKTTVKEVSQKNIEHYS